MNNHQKTFIIISFLIVILIPLYGLSHPLIKDATTNTRLSLGVILTLEIILFPTTYFFLKMLGDTKKILREVLFSSLILVLEVVLIGLFVIAGAFIDNYLKNKTPVTHGEASAAYQTTSEDIVILKKEYLGQIKYGQCYCFSDDCSPKFRITLKNSGQIRYQLPALVFTFAKNGVQEDSRMASDCSEGAYEQYVGIGADEAKTIVVGVSTPINDINNYDWDVSLK